MLNTRDLATLRALKVAFSTRSVRMAFRSGLLVKISSAVEAGQLPGREAFDALVRMAAACEAEANSLAQAHSSAEWLWYLRRLAPFTSSINELRSTAPYVQALLESVSALSSKPSGQNLGANDRLRYATTEDDIATFWRLFAACELVYKLQTVIRWAGKGATIQFRQGTLPRPMRDRRLEGSISLYDKRTAEGFSLLSRAAAARAEPKLDPTESSIVVWGPASGGTWGFDVLDLDQVPFLGEGEWRSKPRWPSELIDLLAVLATPIVSSAFQQLVRNGTPPARETGYRVMSPDSLDQELRLARAMLRVTPVGQSIPQSITDSDERAQAARLQRTDSIMLWPPTHGPPVRIAGPNHVMVDLHAATQRLTRALQRPSVSGHQANAYATHFELSIQSLIDASPWSPGIELRALRGVQLKRGHQWITDVDAVGVRDDVALLVSAKGRPYTDEYDRGDYGAVRNVRTLVEGAVRDWAAKLDDLRQHPVGSNYDVSNYRSLVGVIVLPFVPWVPIGAATSWVAPGLRAVSSSDELRSWLHRSVSL